MAINPAISVDYSQNPRIINIAAPEVSVTVQDINDSLQYIQALPSGIDEPNIISASGKEALGGGVKVGLTVTLLDALIKFEDRTTTTVCKIFGGNVVSFDTQTQEYLEVPATFSNNVMVTYTSSASATQSDLDAIQYSSYQNAVWVKESETTSGVAFPSGTREYPVNNIEDAVIIAHEKGFDTIQILEPIILGDVNLDNLKICGRDRTQTVIYLSPLCSTNNTIFEECYVTGTLSQDVTIRNAVAGTMYYLNGYMLDVSLLGDIHLGGNSTAFVVNCGSVDNTRPVDFYLGGSGNDLVLRGFQGDVRILEANDPDKHHSLYFDFGHIYFDESVTDGYFDVKGHVEVDDNTTGNAVIDASEAMTVENIVKTTFEQVDSEGYNLIDSLELVRRMIHNKVTTEGSIITIWNEDDTVWKQFDLSGGQRVEV